MAAWDRLASSYDHVARKYERQFVDELDGKPRDRELLHAFAGVVGDPVVEIGCGPGHIGAFVAARGRRVIGVDISPTMAALARHRLGSALVADVRSLPFAAEHLGGIVAFYSLIHLPRSDLTPALRECARALSPGGRLLFSAHEGEGGIERDEFLEEAVPFVATLFDLDELISATRDAGFEVTSAERRPPYSNEGSTTRLYVEAVRRY